jgi:glycosyltransferase involved in cell wall biosynthesis
MLSILIPIYNCDVSHLVGELRRQAETLGFHYEICLLDDASEASFQICNRQWTQKINIRYEELPQNIGRAAIRNRLGSMAKFEYLLFMDCDSGVVMPNYLETYVAYLQADRLLYGGRTYLPKPPSDSKYLLHWHYGRQREQQDFASRQAEPYYAFMTNNFLIPRKIFQSITFDEQIRTYGHEDTLFGAELARKGIEILHLNNPLLHLGLETNSVFLEKTATAVQNLARLHLDGKIATTRLSRTYDKLKHWGLVLPLGWSLRPLRPFWISRLTQSARPNLRYLDLYKLSLYIEAMRT